MKAVKTVIEPGACGFKVLLKAGFDEENKGLVNITFHSACEMVTGLNEDFKNLNWKQGVFKKMLDSYVYKACSDKLKHVDCPVPSAILKTLQVLVGAAVEQEVQIKITQVDSDS